MVLQLLPTVRTFHKISTDSQLGKRFLQILLSKGVAALTNNISTSHCVNHWDNALKIQYRSYLTLFKLSKWHSDASPLCWRQCVSIGNFLHILWTCKSLKSFWNSVFSFISQVTGMLTTLSPHLALLGLTIDSFPIQYKTIVSHIFIAAKLTITSAWKSSKALNALEVIRRVNSHYFFEKFTVLNN